MKLLRSVTCELATACMRSRCATTSARRHWKWHASPGVKPLSNLRKHGENVRETNDYRARRNELLVEIETEPEQVVEHWRKRTEQLWGKTAKEVVPH